MSSRFIASLIATVVLTSPAWTQQTAGTSSGAPTATQKEPLKESKPTDFWDGDEPNLAHLVTHPFANKAYVQRQTGPIRDRLNELDQLTAENSRAIKDLDRRAQHGVELAAEKSTLADQHATDALNRAQLAKASAMEASARVSVAEQTVRGLNQYHGSAQTEIRFRAGQSILNKSAKTTLDRFAAPLKTQKGYIVEIHGFAPGRGRVANANAKKMSDSVVRYLVSTQKIPIYRIAVLNTVDGKTGRRIAGHKAARKSRSNGGRVDISILQNDLMTVAQR